MAPAVATYEARNPGHTVLYRVIAAHLETFLASFDADPDAKGLPAYVEREFYDYLQCGILTHGFLRLGCDTCKKEMLLAFSCKRRGFCPSCAGRRMAQMAAHLVERVLPWVPTRQWVVSVPMPLRYWMASSQDLTAQIHTIIRTTISQYYVSQAVARGIERQQAQPGSVTFIQRFGSAINLNLHFHMIFLEGVYLDRTAQGRKPRFIKGEPPTDADIAAVLQTISRRVIRKLRHLGYLEASVEDPVPTGYDPLVDQEPELARTLVASVQQRIAFGERAGQQVRRIGSGFGYEGEHPALTGARCASVHGLSLHANTKVPAHRRDQLERLLRYMARGAVALERLHEDARGDLVYTFTKPWSDGTTGITLSPVELLEKAGGTRAAATGPPGPLWGVSGAAQSCCVGRSSRRRANRGWMGVIPRQSRLTGAGHGCCQRVFALDMTRCPFCQRGALRIIAAITHEAVITRDPPASEPGVRPTSHCTCPFSPRDVRLGGLSPRQSRVASWATCVQRRCVS